jgi:undecaprenyl-diphosphatase
VTLSARLFLTALLLFAAVIALGFAVTAGRFHDFDLAVSHALNLQRGVSPDWFILVMQGISWIGGGIQRYVIVGILALALWRWRGWGSIGNGGCDLSLRTYVRHIEKLFCACSS